MENNYTNYNIKKNDIDDFKINPKAEDIEKHNYAYIFKFEYPLKN